LLGAAFRRVGMLPQQPIQQRADAGRIHGIKSVKSKG
jgi:hypothetical protein